MLTAKDSHWTGLARGRNCWKLYCT